MHISLSFGGQSGIAVPPIDSQPGYWSVHQKLNGKFMHFCSTEHLAKFFEGMIKKTTAGHFSTDSKK